MLYVREITPMRNSNSVTLDIVTSSEARALS